MKSLKINEYPYGKVTKTLEKAVAWLKKNKRKIATKQYDDFDFPDYWDMPKSMSYKLSGDDVDWIQAETDDWYKESNFEKRFELVSGKWIKKS